MLLAVKEQGIVSTTYSEFPPRVCSRTSHATRLPLTIPCSAPRHSQCYWQIEPSNKINHGEHTRALSDQTYPKGRVFLKDSTEHPGKAPRQSSAIPLLSTSSHKLNSCTRHFTITFSFFILNQRLCSLTLEREVGGKRETSI